MKKRIVFVSQHYWPPDFGGELLVSIERFHALSERGFDITVLTSGRPGFPKQQVDRKLKIHRSPVVGVSRQARLLRRLAFVLWTIWHLLWIRMDILYIGDLPGIDVSTSAMVTWIWAGLAKIRGAYSICVHSLADSATASLQTQGWQGWWRTSQFRAVDRVVSVSPALHDAVEAALPGKSSLIVNSVGEEFFSKITGILRQRLRAEAGVLKDDDVIFAFLGSVGWRKGFDTLAEAFAELASTHPHWRLWVIGPRTVTESQNIDPEEVKNVTQALNSFDQQVTYWGRVDDRTKVRDLLCASDAFVFPSRREGLGVAPLEAMATGLPVIVARIPGVTDLGNVEGETGFFIQPGDVEGLKRAMLQLGESSTTRRMMGVAARERIARIFGWSAYLEKWENLCRQEDAYL